MDFIAATENERHPLLQLIFLGFLAFGCVIVFLLLGLALIYFSYGKEVVMAIFTQNLSLKNSISAFRILLMAQNLGLFLAPALLLGVTESKKPTVFYGLAKPKFSVSIIVFWALLFALPFIGFVNELNQKMHLPSFLKALEDWMRQKEDEGIATTAALLKMTNVWTLIINLIVVALAPAVCEEFFFRGAIQRSLWRWTKNPHLAIWLTAIIFSAIHFQFFGFFTRMFLGAGLGYIYYFTGSMWYSILAHFLNNGYAVAMAFYLQQKGMPLTEDAGPNVGWAGYLISVILTLALFKILKDRTLVKQE